MAGHLTVNQKVVGSTPTSPSSRCTFTRLAIVNKENESVFFIRRVAVKTETVKSHLNVGWLPITFSNTP